MRDFYPVETHVEKTISTLDIQKAENCLIDNGIDEDEACSVLQALGYILFDEELFPDL